MEKKPNKEMEEAKEIVNALEKEVRTAIWYASFYERVTLNGKADDVCTAFGKSDEAWGITICQNALLDALTLALSRIIWGTQKNTASLEALCNILEKYRVMKFFSEPDQKKAEKLVEDVKQDILGNHQCAGLKNYRNTWLAHVGINSGLKKSKGPKNMQYGYPLDILEKLIPKVEDFLHLLNGSLPDFKFSTEATKEKADKFWKYAAHLEEDLRLCKDE